ncbi:MAG: hypothetical protein GY940_10845, partial [bacterium]|nr:hypothetical protein [bacterium]
TKGIRYRRIGKDWGKDYEFDLVVEGDDEIHVGEIKKGELNVSTEINKMESIIQRESFYKNKTVKYILIADRFPNKPEKENILYISIPEWLELRTSS